VLEPNKARADRGSAGRSGVGRLWLCRAVHEVVVGALVREDRVLLVHRRPDKRANPDVWDLPGGLIEAGESELDALARELQEELGVQIATGSVSHLCRLTAGSVDAPAVLSAWLVREWQGTPLNVAPEEHDAMSWSRVEELPPPPHVLARTALVNAMRSLRD
jgi:8-oxo-dGTP diphosphatase